MKRRIDFGNVLVFAILGWLILGWSMVLLNTSCTKPMPMYQGVLESVEIVSDGGLFGGHYYLASFKDGRVITVGSQPKGGFKVGATYDYYDAYGSRWLEEVR